MKEELEERLTARPVPAQGQHASGPSEEARQTLHFVNQVEAVIAAGPHGKLDEYISVVDLLFNAKALFEKTRYADGLQQARGLLATAMDDLEFEFKDMLQRRSQQAAAKLTKEHLKDVRMTRPQAVPVEERIGEGKPAVPEPLENVDKVALPELLPPAAVRWLHQIATRMQFGGAAARCAEAYRTVRAEVLQNCLTSLETDLVTGVCVEEMAWETLEKTVKEWVIQMNILVGVLLPGEYDLCNRVLDGLGREQGRAFAELVRGTAACTAENLLKVGGAIAAKRFPEQLFAMLDMFDTVEDLIADGQQVFCGPGSEEVLGRLQGLPLLLAGAVLATFEQFTKLLQDHPAVSDGPTRRRLGFFRGSQPSEDIYNLVPRGGTVHPITSYVVNYIRGYLHRLGKRNYVSILERVFREFGSQPGGSPRTVDVETALLVMALRRNLEARARLYRDEALQELFLVNNINYLCRAMLLWHGWHGRGLLRALSQAQKGGNVELMHTLTELQDDRIVTHHATNFQRLALAKITAILGDPSLEVRGVRGIAQPPEPSTSADVKSKLKRFNPAFEELCTRQQEWIIPDDELRVRIRGQWVSLIKERYRRLLLPHWDDVVSSKYYLYRPEDLEIRIVSFFSSQNCQ